jgi:hypothetical protein
MAFVDCVCSFCGIAYKGRVRGKVHDNCKRYCSMKRKSDFQRSAKPVTKEWLEYKYLVEKLDCTQISLMVGRDPKSVWNWLKDFGIQTRGRGYGVPPDKLKGRMGYMKGKKHSAETRAKLREAALRDGRVPWGKGNEPYWRGKTGELHPTWRGGNTPERQRFYESKEWKSLIPKVWAKYGGCCFRCGIKYTNEMKMFHIHHYDSFTTVPDRRADIDNLMLMCYDCHKWTHSNNNTNKEFLGEGH